MGPERLGHLLERYAAALELFARQWCAVPEDVVQNAFAKLASQPQEPTHVAAWLYHVVRNGAISAGRSERRRRHHESAATQRSSWFTEDSDSRLDAATVSQALGDLPLEQREVIVAHLWGGLTFEEIAKLTSSSATSAYRKYVAGLAELRTRLDSPCPPNLKT